MCKNSKLNSQRFNNMVRGGNVLEVTQVNKETGRNMRVPVVPSAALRAQGTLRISTVTYVLVTIFRPAAARLHHYFFTWL